MTFIKANQAEQLILAINGLDFTDYLDSFQISYNSVDPLAGISYITGTLKLVKPLGVANIQFDPRFSNNFQPGGLIQIFSQGNLLPIAGTLYILTADYDRRTTVDLNVGCSLSKNNNKTSRNSGLCIDFGSKYPVGEAIRTLLQGSGILNQNIWNADIIGLNKYKLAEPFQLDNNTNLIQSAAQLAALYGRLIYQDNTGVIRFKNIYQKIENFAIVAQEKNLLAYTIASQPEQAIKIAEVTYGDTKVLSLLGTTSNSASSNDISVEVLTTRNDALKQVTQQLKEYRELPTGTKVLIAETSVISTYETTTSVARNGQLTLINDCYPSNEARILSRVTTTKSDNTSVLQAWLAYKNTASVPTGFTVSGVITSSKKEELWEYQDNVITIEQTTFAPIAKVIPIIADRQLASSNTAISDVAPLTLIPDTKTIEVYSKSFENSGRWRYSKTEYLNRNLIDPTAILARAAVTGAPLNDILENQSELAPISNILEFNSSLPDFESYDTTIETATEEKVILIGSEFNDGLIETYSLGNYYEPDFEMLQSMAKAIFEFKNGRIFGCTAAMSLPDKYYWQKLSPLAEAKVFEDSGKSFIYKIDSPAVVFAATELVFSFSGSCLGYTEDSNFNSFADNIQPLPFAPVSVASELFVFDDIDYTVTQTFEVV